MNNFLTAKSKEDKAKAWEDLVHSLKQTNHHHRNNKNGGSVDSYNSRGSQQKQRKGIGSSGSVGSSGSNHSLGFIQFHPKPSSSSSSSVNGVGGSGGMSVTSGLTSAGTATDITQYYVGGRGGAGNNGGSEQQQYDNGGAMATTPPSVTGGDHKPPLFPVITTTSSSKVVLGGGGGVDELISPLSDNEYYEDDYDDTPEQQQEEEEENGVSRALLNVDDTEEELAVYEDEEEEDVSALKGVTLFDSLSSIHVHDDDNGDVEVPPPPPPPTVMPKLQPPMRDDNSHSVRDMIGRYEKKEVALLEEEESESWSPSMIRRKSDQLFSSPEQEQRKQYQFYPEGEQQGEERGPDENQFSLEWQQQDVEPSPGANVPTTAAAAVTTVAATEAPTQRPRKPKKKRFIGGGSGSKCSLEDQIRLVLGNNNNYNSHDEGHKGDNDASASDILRELNSSKEQQQQQPLRSSPSVINRLPPASISFGSKSKQQQGESQQQQRISKQSTVANGAKSKKTPALLAPSRRDLHSLRIRQMVSESTLANNDDVGGSAAQVENTTIATVATASTTTTNTTRESSVVRPVRGGKGFFTRTGPSSNPTSSGLLYSSDMITRDDDTDNFEFYPGLQPNNGGRPTAPQEMYGSSPPRGGTVTPEKPGSPTNSLAESINELKASISELKNAGVGGVGKSTSTLVWNESTGRYVIRDVDDESFDDMVSKGPTVTQESDDDEEEEEEEQDSSYMFKMPNHITRGSILDDDVVDEAVRLAAMDGMSSASTSVGATSGDESLNNFLASPDEEEEEDAFFVVERSNQNTVDDKWRAFQQSSGNDAFQLNSWGNNNDDGFGDDFADDASFPSEVQWGANDWTDWEDGEAGKHFDKMNFVSPASVPSSNRQDPFNPFAQLVLQSLD